MCHTLYHTVTNVIILLKSNYLHLYIPAVNPSATVDVVAVVVVVVDAVINTESHMDIVPNLLTLRSKLHIKL